MAMRRGERFPAIAVVSDAGRFFVRDGFHQGSGGSGLRARRGRRLRFPGSAQARLRGISFAGAEREGWDSAWIAYLEAGLMNRRFARAGVGGQKD